MAKRGVVSKKSLKDKDTRPVRWRKYPHLFLIVCEDKKTEPYYFERFINKFPEETVFLRAVGTGMSSLGVVEQSLIEKNKLAEESNKSVDEVWTVFDKDDAEKSFGNTERFKNAFKKAQELKHKVAYSNEVFELWLLLHLTNVPVERPIPRIEIYNNINNTIKESVKYKDFEYEHGNTNVVDIIAEIGNEEKAIQRAQDLLKSHNETPPIDANPSTTVHILIKRLRELIIYYSFTPE
ncbi:MAG: RloB domain-containing protein [Bacteroidetes bacterium]|nr:RloB domain-containing protein [Bacteroidota bacterium]